ncbi:MAG TPA: hypothetical protein VL500_05680, partial [Candidatus Eisenbacteria bacterium]|nr:hypothetical protein [Candidatus Eisenbacteria bacterium]
MKRLLRLLSLAVVGSGAVLLGGAVYEGWCRGFSPDFELGNWDPVIRGALGGASVAFGTLAYLYFGHAAEGRRRRQAFYAALRSVAVLTLSLCEMG